MPRARKRRSDQAFSGTPQALHTRLLKMLSGLKNSSVDYKENEPLSAHTSFRIGGPARWLAEPENAEQLICLLSALREKGIRYFVKGNGSNLLAADEGFDGLSKVQVDVALPIEVSKTESITTNGTKQ